MKAFPKFPHFTIAEFTHSRRAVEAGLDNSLPENLLGAASFTIAGMVRIRAYLGHPITITSGYRCPSVNYLVRGSKTSQHLDAEAVDFICPKFGTPEQIYERLKRSMASLGIDQLILEPGWVHVSFTHLPRYTALDLSGRRT